MICANDVTNKVASKPSDPCTSTDAPSYEQNHVLSLLLTLFNS
jgi:hypothetical protein